MARAKMIISKTWAQASLLTFLLGFTGLGILAAIIYTQHAPIPGRVVGPGGGVLFTREDILAGQHVFQKYGLMQHGTLFGHGAYLGPDFTAQYLHLAAEDMLAFYSGKTEPDAEARERVVRELKANLYDETADALPWTPGQVHAFERLTAFYRDYFGPLASQQGVKRPVIRDAAEVRRLTSFFAWAAWAATANRPGTDYSYTNNWPAGAAGRQRARPRPGLPLERAEPDRPAGRHRADPVPLRPLRTCWAGTAPTRSPACRRCSSARRRRCG